MGLRRRDEALSRPDGDTCGGSFKVRARRPMGSGPPRDAGALAYPSRSLVMIEFKARLLFKWSSLLDRSLARPRPLDDLKVVVRSLSELKPNPRNARTHSRRQIRQIADSIEAFGFNNPVLVDEDGRHHRRPRPCRGSKAARHDRGADRLPRAHERGREARLRDRRQPAR